MRDMQKFRRDQRDGQLASQRFAVIRTLTTTVISRTLSRALRRGRISQETARRCAHNWVLEQNARPKHLVWSRVASAELVQAGIFRRRGQYAQARYSLGTVRTAIQHSRPLTV